MQNTQAIPHITDHAIRSLRNLIDMQVMLVVGLKIFLRLV